MVRTFQIKKGLDLNLTGSAEKHMRDLAKAKECVVYPTDFLGVSPRLAVKEGDVVLAGDVLFRDKQTERIAFVTPVSGTVKAIERGERRKLLAIRIEADAEQKSREFDVKDCTTKDAVLDVLLSSGLFAFFRQRPYDVTASPVDTPKGIFISAFSKMPLAADFSYVVEGREEQFLKGISVLSTLAPVRLGISPEQQEKKFAQTTDADVYIFNGPNPSGNVGVQINHIDPINKGEVAWTVDAETVITIGELFQTGRVELKRRIAVAGSKVEAPQYVETYIGTPLAHILDGQLTTDLADAHIRIINGNPLVGIKSQATDALRAFSHEVCIIPEGDDVHEVFGWIAPRLKQFSTHHSYLSWLFGRRRQYDLDCRVKGGERHMIMSGEYESVFPMDIYPAHLIKAIITGDIDRQEELGIYEVAPEDFAVAEFIDSSKLELQRIVREGLDILRKENA